MKLHEMQRDVFFSKGREVEITTKNGTSVGYLVGHDGKNAILEIDKVKYPFYHTLIKSIKRYKKL